MTAEEAFEIINNLNVRENLRKYSPQWSIVSMNYDGEIVAVTSYKKCPQTDEQIEEFKKYENTFQMTAWPGRFNDVEDLKRKVAESTSDAKQY